MSHVFQRYMRKPYPVAVRGEGPYIVDSSGKRYLDAASGAGVSSLGYSDIGVADAIAKQAHELAYVYNAYFTTEASERLADALVEMMPKGLDWVFFGSGGSESMDGALKMALQFHLDNGQSTRRRFIARRQSYHGCAMGGLAVSGNVIRRMLFEDVLMPADFVSPCYAYRDQHPGEADEAYVARLAQELEATIQRVGPHTVAAFVAEPVVGATNGAVPALPGYFKAMKTVLDRYGILFIADEILTGAGRTGTYRHRDACQGPGRGLSADLGHRRLGPCLRHHCRQARLLHTRAHLQRQRHTVCSGPGRHHGHPRTSATRTRANDGPAIASGPGRAICQPPACRRHSRPRLAAGP